MKLWTQRGGFEAAKYVWGGEVSGIGAVPRVLGEAEQGCVWGGGGATCNVHALLVQQSKTCTVPECRSGLLVFWCVFHVIRVVACQHVCSVRMLSTCTARTDDNVLVYQPPSTPSPSPPLPLGPGAHPHECAAVEGGDRAGGCRQRQASSVTGGGVLPKPGGPVAGPRQAGDV